MAKSLPQLLPPLQPRLSRDSWDKTFIFLHPRNYLEGIVSRHPTGGFLPWFGFVIVFIYIKPERVQLCTTTGVKTATAVTSTETAVFFLPTAILAVFTASYPPATAAAYAILPACNSTIVFLFHHQPFSFLAVTISTVTLATFTLTVFTLTLPSPSPFPPHCICSYHLHPHPCLIRDLYRQPPYPHHIYIGCGYHCRCRLLFFRLCQVKRSMHCYMYCRECLQ